LALKRHSCPQSQVLTSSHASRYIIQNVHSTTELMKLSQKTDFSQYEPWQAQSLDIQDKHCTRSKIQKQSLIK